MMTLLQPEQSIEARELLSLSQAKVAKESGINRAYLSQFENGKRILNDADNDALYHYYDEKGLDVKALNQSPAAQSQEQVFTPVYSVAPMQIKDGIVISRDMDSETTESLMGEYYDLEESIVKQLEEPVVRGFLFGDLYKSDTYDKALPVLLACYRQRQIKLTLQGRENSTGKQPDKISVIREFLNAELAKGS